MLITSSIPNLVNGISQQPPTLRLPSQAEGQTNFLSSVADGLVRRPGTRHVARLTNAPWASAFLHTISRDRREKYVVSKTDDRLRVFDAKTGVERAVAAPNGWGYIQNAGPDDLRAVTVADYTFLVNRKRTVQMAATATPARRNEAIIHVRAGNYGKTYKVFLDGTERASYTTANGNDTEDLPSVRTSNIASKLIEGLQSSAAVLPGFSFRQEGDLIIISRNNESPFDLRIEDSSGGASMKAFGPSTQRFSDLPTVANDGFQTEVVGDNQNSFDNYFVRYEATGGSGVWKEVAKWGEKTSFDPATMPHILVREADGTFTFKRAAWEARKVGDVDKVPNPTFVGRTIGDVFFHRNRLGFLSDESVILSKAGDFFNLWPDTVPTSLDTDPLDLAVTNTKVSLLNHALPFNESLLLFSDNAQFVLRGGDVLSAQTAYITLTTEFESSENVRPCGIGQFVYFPVPRGSYSTIREYFVSPDTDTNDAADVTSHCPRYLPAGVSRLVGSSSEDMLLALSSVSPNMLWVYKFFMGGEGKLQSAWSCWSFDKGSKILTADIVDGELYLIISRPDGVYLERMDLEGGASDEGANFHYHVDRGVFLTDGRFDGTHTTFTLPYATSEPLWVISAGTAEGRSWNYTKPTPSTVRLAGDLTRARLFAGTRFTSEYVFSTFFPRQGSGEGSVAADDGRLQVRRLSIIYSSTAYFEVHSRPEGRDTSIKTFTGRTLAHPSSAPGTVRLTEGRFTVPIMCRNRSADIRIVSDSYLPCAFTSAEWEATYHPRAKRI